MKPRLWNQSTNESPSGFTLIELLVVIAIIAILAGLLLPDGCFVVLYRDLQDLRWIQERLPGP